MSIPLIAKLRKAFIGDEGLVDAADVDVSNTTLTGLLGNVGKAQSAFDRIDATGLGAQVREITGSFFSTYSEGSQNTNTWYGGRQTVNIRVNPSANGQYTFRMPASDDMNSVFNDLAARGLGEVFTITLEYSGGNTGLVNRNRLTVTNANVSNGFPQGTFPTVLAQGQSATFRIDRVGGITGSWERLGIQQAVNPVPTFGEFVFQTAGWNNADGSSLPSGANVLKGYAFPVLGSNPNDGTLRQGLLDSGVDDRIIYDGDYVVWTADSFTSWTDGDSWFVLPRNQLEMVSREEGNFLAQVTEIDNRVDIGFVDSLTNDALVWLSENPLAEAPFLDPSTDTNNPRSGDNYPYVGGREDKNAEGQFTLGYNRFNNYITIGITPSFFTGHDAKDVEVRVRDSDGGVIDSFNLDSDFTIKDDATFTNNTVRHYIRNTSINYPFLATIEIVLTQVQRHFRLNPQSVDVTQNVNNIQQSQLSDEVRDLLNQTPASVNIPDPIDPALTATVTLTLNSPASDARFLSASATAPYPTQLSDFDQVAVDNPRYQATDVILFVAVPEPANYALMNTTTDSVVALDSSEPSVEVIESLFDSGLTWFVYRVTGITSGNRFEVERVTTEQKLAIINRIDNLEANVRRIDAEQSAIPNDVRSVLEHNVTVTEETSPNKVASAFNNGLGTGGTQKVFFEASANAPSGGSLASNAFSVTDALPRAKRKLLYVGSDHNYANAVLVHAFDGASATNDLITYQDGQLFAKVFVPAQPASTTTVTTYPAPSARVSGSGIWQTIETLTFSNGVPVPLADELFFTRNLPTSNVTLNISYRGHANGNIFGAGSATLNVQPGIESSTTFNISDGSETATVEVRHLSNNQIRVSVTERVGAGLPTINDVQVILSFDETRTIPATNNSRRDVLLQSGIVSGQPNVIAFKPSDTDTLIAVSSDREIDTNFTYSTLFGAGLAGHLTVFAEDAEFFDFQNINPTNTTVQTLDDNANNPNYGLFDTNYTHETLVSLDTALEVDNSQGDKVKVGEELVLVASDNSRWRLSVDTSGNLITTQEP